MPFVLFHAYSRDAVKQRIAAQSGAVTPVNGPTQQSLASSRASELVRAAHRPNATGERGFGLYGQTPGRALAQKGNQGTAKENGLIDNFRPSRQNWVEHGLARLSSPPVLK